MESISLWIKLPYTLFVIVFVPVYWIRYGPTNLLWISDIALIVTLAALWLESPFLVGMMTTGVLITDIIWSLIFFTKLIRQTGSVGLVGYMFNPEISVFIRALSLFHVALPVVQLWALGKLGYDPRAWKYQVLLGWILVPLTYAVTQPRQNINWVFGVIDVPQQWMPASLYLVTLMIIYPILICFPTHRLLMALFKTVG